MTQLFEHLVSFGFGVLVGGGSGLIIGFFVAKLSRPDQFNRRQDQ